MKAAAPARGTPQCDQPAEAVPVTHSFEDSAGYEHFMGPWSRAAGLQFLDWLAPPRQARWLDVGCGTGVFTGLIQQSCAPAAVFAIDPEGSQIDHALNRSTVKGATFSVADAQALPFSGGTFDVVVAALVLNFVSEPQQAMSEMRRVARPGGTIAAYVWDFDAERSPSWPLRAAMRRLGVPVPAIPHGASSNCASLRELFVDGGLNDPTVISIETTVPYASFDAFWTSQTTRYSPTTKIIEALTKDDREALKRLVQSEVVGGQSGCVRYTARANAIKCCVRRNAGRV